MLSRRNLVMMLTMFGVVLVLFLSTAVLREYFNDYDVNHAAQAERIIIVFSHNDRCPGHMCVIQNPWQLGMISPLLQIKAVCPAVHLFQDSRA